ncbi:MAG: hypothetical protein PHX93_01225 [Candidatus Peribacteraceae bacterium]|nr:hypothetical protein [Candidatus Peribacteraceae bacterium]
MRCLFVDLASHSGLLACVTEERVIASEDSDHRVGDHELIPLFEKTLQAAGWKVGDLTHCACVTGPGGFMSLRVAVAFANTLIHQLKISGAGIHLSDLYAARTPLPSPLPPGEGGAERRERGKTQEDFLWLHSTKKHELFVRGFGSFASLWPEPSHVTIDAFLERLPQGALWTGELIPEHVALFQDTQLQPALLRSLVGILPSFLARQKYGSALLEPWYGRGW